MVLKELGDLQVQVGVYLSGGKYTAVVDVSTETVTGLIGQGASAPDALEALAKRIREEKASGELV